MAAVSIGVETEQSQWFSFCAYYLFLCGSSTNSFIYTARSAKFRKAVKEIWKHSKCGKLRPDVVGIAAERREGHVIYLRGTFKKEQVYLHQ